MKKFFQNAVLVLVLSLTACQGSPTAAAIKPAQADPEFLSTPMPAIDWSDRSLYQQGLTERSQSILEELDGSTIYHIMLEIDPSLHQVYGKQEIDYTNQEEVTLAEIYFHLFPNLLGGRMDVSNVQVNGQVVTPELGPNDGYLRVSLEKALKPGESLTMRLDFNVIVPQRSDTNYGVFVATEGYLTLAHSYPMLAVFDEEGWNITPPPAQADPTYGDASFFIVNVTAPEELVLVASGIEVGRQLQGSRQTTIFALGPGRDFFLAASANYRKFSRQSGDVTINAYVPAELEAGAWQSIGFVEQAIRIFSRRYGMYPYSEIDIAATPTLALGVEYPGVTAINKLLFDPEANISGTPSYYYFEATVAHEVGHQWFYNMVGNDQLDEPWLDESLTQYVTWQYFQDKCGSECAAGFEESLIGRWERVNKETIPLGMPVEFYEGREYGAIIYGRGAYFFEALEEKMGADTFDAFMLEYAQNNSWGIASTATLRALAEDHCQCDLSTLFNEWVYP
ncbi:MAG: M1 family metallopeptidase [Anaerolineales bacterium]|nr:M1 family metallopeptidase [Anaerolineales bacterium]